MTIVKTTFILTSLALLTSCADNSDNFIKKRLPVEIYELDIPTTAAINQNIQIQLKAQATNGCFSDLEIEFIETNTRHYLFKATGLFQSDGTCPHNMVYQDTIIIFKATMTGKHFFQTNESTFDIRKDTIDINY